MLGIVDPHPNRCVLFVGDPPKKTNVRLFFLFPDKTPPKGRPLKSKSTTHILCMDEILHHLETMAFPWLLGIYRGIESVTVGFLNGGPGQVFSRVCQVRTDFATIHR